MLHGHCRWQAVCEKNLCAIFETVRLKILIFILDEAKQLPYTATIIDHPDVSIFNIRGEEFIQMPKSVYLEEKTKLESSHKDSYAQQIIKLTDELNKYKNVVQTIKNQLKNI